MNRDLIYPKANIRRRAMRMPHNFIFDWFFLGHAYRHHHYHHERHEMRYYCGGIKTWHMRLPYGVCIQLPLLMSMPCSSHFRPHRTQSCPNKKGLNRHFLLGCNVLVIHLSLMLTDNRRNTLSWWKKICSIHKSGHIYVAGLWCVPEISCCDQVLFLWWNFFLNPHIYFHKKNNKM